jgi:CRISPR-associated protein Csd1
MILQSLNDYYHRKAADPESGIAPPGFEWKEIPYILTIDPVGNPVSLSSTYEGEGKSKRAKRYLVPQSVKRSSGIAANLLWDNPEYALGVKPRKNSTEKHAAFVKQISDLAITADPGIDALLSFLQKADKSALLKQFEPTWSEMLDEGKNVSFQLAGETTLVAERPAVKSRVIKRTAAAGGQTIRCLITGEQETIERLHPPIKGVYGAQATGANIVSFNLDAFRSYGKEQGANAPIGKHAAFAYTTALNHLLSKDSRQRMQVGDASTVFWSEKPSDLETRIVDFFGEPPKDDPDRGVRAVESLFKSVHTGADSYDENTAKFFVLGLAPNASRISVRFWIVSTVFEMASNIRQHFEDLRIVHGPKDRDTFSLFRLLVSTATQGKADNIPPNLSGDIMRAVLGGLPYPVTLLQAAIRRIRAEHEINYQRAAIIKACINRATRYRTPEIKEELTVSLDETNSNIGYRLGRLFAALEKIQSEANPGINATIRDRCYGSASSTPVTIFGNLMRLKNHHLAKLDSAGRRIYFERMLGQIMDDINDFPAHLVLADQGRFAIGYYHQMQNFYTKKSE